MAAWRASCSPEGLREGAVPKLPLKSLCCLPGLRPVARRAEPGWSWGSWQAGVDRWVLGLVDLGLSPRLSTWQWWKLGHEAALFISVSSSFAEPVPFQEKPAHTCTPGAAPGAQRAACPPAAYLISRGHADPLTRGLGQGGRVGAAGMGVGSPAPGPLGERPPLQQGARWTAPAELGLAWDCFIASGQCSSPAPPL